MLTFATCSVHCNAYLQLDDEQLPVPVPSTTDRRSTSSSRSDVANTQHTNVAADVATVERLWMLVLARDILAGPFQQYIAEQQQQQQQHQQQQQQQQHQQQQQQQTAEPLTVARTQQLLQQCIAETLNGGVAEDTAAVEHLLRELDVACKCSVDVWQQSDTEVLQQWAAVVHSSGETAVADLRQVNCY
jgi:FixJ family two-component response regulator